MTGRFLSSAIGLLLSPIVLAGCAPEPEARILFIGNSYTASNDLPGAVEALAKSAGHPVEADARAPGGWWLRDHIASAESLDAITTGEFDFVVLQEQSMVPAAPDLAETESRPAAVDLATRARGEGASVVFFMTWGHRNGSADVGHSSYQSMQVAVANTYYQLGTISVSEVAPVGAAWWMALHERPDITLYQQDGSHPSPGGTYLAAVVLTGTLLPVHPDEFDTDLGLDPDHAAALRGFASRAIAGERPWR